MKRTLQTVSSIHTTLPRDHGWLSTAAILTYFLGNTPLHLAMESAHAEAACLLIEAGADRTRVRFLHVRYLKIVKLIHTSRITWMGKPQKVLRGWAVRNNGERGRMSSNAVEKSEK